MQHYRELQSTLLRLEDMRQELKVCMQLAANQRCMEPMCVARLCLPLRHPKVRADGCRRLSSRSLKQQPPLCNIVQAPLSSRCHAAVYSVAKTCRHLLCRPHALWKVMHSLTRQHWRSSWQLQFSMPRRWGQTWRQSVRRMPRLEGSCWTCRGSQLRGLPRLCLRPTAPLQQVSLLHRCTRCV